MIKRIAFLLFAFLLSIHVSPQTRKIEQLKKENQSLKKQITESENLLQSTRKDTRTQLANLALVNAQINDKQRFIEKVAQDVDILESHIRVLHKQLAKLEADLQLCKRKYKHALMFVFNHKLTHSKWLFVLSAKDFKSMTRRLRYASEYAKYQRIQGEAIKKREALVRLKRQEIDQRKQDQQRLLESSKEEAKALNGKKEEQRQLIDQLNKKQSTIQQRIAQQKRRQQQLNNQIDRLIQIEIAAAERRRKAAEEAARRAEAERRRKAQEEARQQQAAKASTRNVRKKETVATPSTQTKWIAENKADRELSGSFAQNKGRLSVPVTGPYTITSHYGAYNVAGLNNVQLDNKGIDITAQRGAAARAVFSGEVTTIFSFNNLYNVIVRHGNYLSVYCNLSNVSVRKGQMVSERQTLGTIATDATGNATLHFQLRKETSRLNPEQWIRR